MGLFKDENTWNKEYLKASQASGVPVSILKGFTGMESAFNPNAYRAEPQIKDASYGLMQILNKTAAASGFRGSPKDLFKPEINTLYGAKHIRGLLSRYANLTDAVAAYNMGYPRRAEATTPLLVRLYGQPQTGWIYANQPYVDRIAAYIAYYQTFERPDPVKRKKLEDLIKKKDYQTPRSMLLNPLFPSSVGKAA